LLHDLLQGVVSDTAGNTYEVSWPWSDAPSTLLPCNKVKQQKIFSNIVSISFFLTSLAQRVNQKLRAQINTDGKSHREPFKTFLLSFILRARINFNRHRGTFVEPQFNLFR